MKTGALNRGKEITLPKLTRRDCWNRCQRKEKKTNKFREEGGVHVLKTEDSETQRTGENILKHRP